jgi:hypothetical protein
MILAMTVTVDQYWLTMIIAIFLPMLVGLVTKQVASENVKAVLLLLLSAVAGTVVSWQNNNGTFDVKDAIVTTVLTFVIAVGSHFGLLKPLSITGSQGAIQRKTATFGVG